MILIIRIVGIIMTRLTNNDTNGLENCDTFESVVMEYDDNDMSWRPNGSNWTTDDTSDAYFRHSVIKPNESFWFLGKYGAFVMESSFNHELSILIPININEQNCSQKC